jgi:hypothetical protein
MTLTEFAALWQFIGSIVIYLLAFILFIIALVGASKKGFTRQRVALVVLALGAVFTVYLAYNVHEIAPADWAQILLTLGLVAVTGFYALSSSRQADASVKMAEAMVKPTLIPYFEITSDFDEERYVRFNAGVDNDGNGPAYDLEFWLEDDSKPPTKLISTGGKVPVLRAQRGTPWVVPDPKLHFPKSKNVQRRFFIIKYRGIVGEYEVRQPFVLATAENDKPIARLESIALKPLRKRNLGD